MTLKKCIKATASLNDADVESVLESFDAYEGSMSQEEAAKLAIDDVIEVVTQERKEYIDLFNETYPEIKPNATAEVFDISKIVSPIDPKASQTEKAKQLRALGVANEKIIKPILKSIDEKYGTKSGVNHKELSKIVEKANRPNILAAKPWHDVEHIRDGFRFKTVLDDFSKLPEIIKDLNDHGIGIVKADVDKALTPLSWGWRIVAFDLHMPNGQVVEWYLPVKELEEAKKVKGHQLFENWRNKDMTKLLPAEVADYLADLIESNETYNNAWTEFLKRTGQTDKAILPSLTKASALSLSPTTLKSLYSSSPVTGLESDQSPETLEKDLPEENKTNTLPPSTDSKTVELSKLVSSYNASLPQTAIRGTQKLDLQSGKDEVQTGDFIQRSDPVKEKPKKSIGIRHLKQLIKVLQSENHGTRKIVFHLRATQEEAFGPNSAEEHGVLKGGFYAGTNEIVLIAENIKSASDAMAVIRHEVFGHYGLRQLLNKNGVYDKLLDRVYNSRTGELKDLYKWVAKAYPELVAKKDVRSIADEMLARAAETKTKSNLLTKIYDQIIKLLNKLGFVLDTVNHSEVRALIRLSEANLRKKIINTTYGDLVWSNKIAGSKDPKVLYSRAADDANDAPTDGNLGMPEENWKQFTARMLHDSFNRVKTLQETITEQGGTVETKSDVYGAEERSSSKISHGLKVLGRTYMDPMLKLMDKNKISIDTLDKFLMAKHAQERNEYIASINEDMQDGGSGITNQEAKDTLDELRDQREALEEIAEFVYGANNESLDTLVKNGHLKEATVKEWRARWKYYVPLKGKEGEEVRAGTGTGFAIAGTWIKEAMGRGAGNLAESPTAHSFAQAETAIVRTEKSKVGQALVELVRANPDPAFWSISQRTFKQFETIYGEPFEGYEDAPEGLIENLDYSRVKAITLEERAAAKAEGRKPVAKVVYKLDQNYKRRDDVFAVMVKGEELLIQIKDTVVMEQLKKMNTTQLNIVVRGFGVVNRYLAMINTALNPEFVITNFERDFQTAMINLGGEHSGKIAAKVMKGIPGAVRGIFQSTFDTKGQSEWRDLFNEMEEEGGTIGFFGLEDIDTKVQNIQRKLEDNHGVLGKTKQGILAVRDVVLDANLSVENASRLSAYKVIKEAAMANGMSAKDAKAKAASVAKNLTVNFNRKGEMAPVLNSAYLFYNASIQGSMRIFSALKHKRVRKIVGGVAATFFAVAMYNRGAGDDDDGIPYWDKISDYTKQTNLIIMHPDGSGNYSKIKLPYGYNVFAYSGYAAHDLMFNDKTSATKTAINVLSAAMNAFNPIQGADLIDTIMPTFVKPFVQDSRNMNFMGAKVKPEYPFDNYDRPESQKHFKSTNPQLVEMMEALNSATGGDQTHAGTIDVSPETVKHYVSWLTGGMGMFGTRTVGLASDLITGEEVEQKNIPFIRALGGKTGSHYDTDRFYTAIKEVAAVEAQLKLHKGTDNYIDYRTEHNEVHKLSMHVRRYKNKIKRLRTQRDKAYLNEDRDLANEKREEIRQVMMDFSMRYDDALEAQE